MRPGFKVWLLSLAALAAAQVAADEPLEVAAGDFGCISDMTPVRGFFVGNLLGDLAATVEVASSSDGGVYPPGSVVQLVPTEAMVKHRQGYNAATRDWEFFELDVAPDETSIRGRGFADVVNRFGGNCFACHVKAEPQWDLICETGHGCDPIPLTAELVKVIQKADPRCASAAELTPEEQATLKTLSGVS